MNEPNFQTNGINFFMADALAFLKLIPDNYYDVVFCDPPYGIGMSKSAGKSKKTKDQNWDNEPMSKEFFIEQKRVSKNQIIWGANHFMDNLPEPRNTKSWLIWDKRENIIPERTFADAEIAWTSFESPIRVFRFYWDGFLQRQKETRIHPTQKPVSLYEWMLMKYCKKGDKILDTFGGSFSSAIACYKMEFKLDIVEINPTIFDKGVQRFKEHISQTSLF